MPVASVPVAAAVVTFSTVISGSVSGFDEESYKERLAAVLAGVSTRDILLNVAAGSASVTARIGVASDAVANSTMHTLNTYTTGTLSAALGVQIQSIAPPTLVRIPRPDSIGVNGTRDEASLSTENQTPTEHIVLYVVLAVVLLLLAVAFAWCVGLCGGGRRAQQYDFGHKAEFSKGPTTWASDKRNAPSNLARTSPWTTRRGLSGRISTRALPLTTRRCAVSEMLKRDEDVRSAVYLARARPGRRRPSPRQPG